MNDQIPAPSINQRLEYLRQRLNDECISYGELHELQNLAAHIEAGDVQLLEAAGVPEHQARFRTIYTESLREAVFEYPDKYYWPVENVPVVAAKMFAALDKGTFNHDSPAFRKTVKALGIKPTRTAILNYWNGRST